MEWAEAVWDQLLGEVDLEAAWRAALPDLSAAAQPFARVKGPAGATVASTLRLGWRFPSAYAFINRSGTLLDLRDTCPLVIVANAKRDLHVMDAASM